MNDRTFIDSNVLIYAHDVDAGPKQRIAKREIEELWTTHTGVLSLQVLQEFYVNATGKIPSPLPKDVARRVINSYVPWCAEITSADLAVAFRIADEAKIRFWDALIVAAALRAGATRVLSEDLNPGQIILGVRIENPFLQSSP